LTVTLGACKCKIAKPDRDEPVGGLIVVLSSFDVPDQGACSGDLLNAALAILSHISGSFLGTIQGFSPNMAIFFMQLSPSIF
jgi:hypothetical protein